MTDENNKIDQNLLKRATEALEKLAFGAVRGDGTDGQPASPRHAYIWQPERETLKPLYQVSRLPIDLLLGVDRPKMLLQENTHRFAQGLPANNALLWGARGMGKSSLVKALHGHLSNEHLSNGRSSKGQSKGQQDRPLELIEISRTDIASLGTLNDILAARPAQCLIYCDDLSFDYDDGAYKSLKTVLDGGLAGRPSNVLFYATSNRRHLMPRDMVENEAGSAINPGEAVEEKLSLSDRFGLWLGFHKCDQETYLNMIAAYCHHFGLDLPQDEWRAAALEWQVTRGARSGRVAWQFFQDLAGERGVKIG